MLDKKVCVVGVGYVGLPCALMLAKSGCKVVGYDLNDDKIRLLNEGHVDDELQELYNLSEVRENFTATMQLPRADVFIIAVPTPILQDRKVAELSALADAVTQVAEVLEKGNLIIVESTVPPMTMRNLVIPIIEKKGLDAAKDIYLAHCPERLLPGNVVYEITYNNRIVGGYTKESAELAAKVYQCFVQGEISLTDDVTAEMCKLMENTYRDVNIALANELSEVCETVGVNTNEAIELANRHPRVNLLKPGIGVGGHCLPIDPWFIHEVSPYNSTLINAARHINDGRPARVTDRICKILSQDISQKFAILGKTYKEETTDTRESPAGEVFQRLKDAGYHVVAYDSEVDKDASLAETVSGCRYLFVLVRHKKMMQELKEYEAAEKNKGNEVNIVYF